MSRHSKNNTSLAWFTNAEREKLTYGTRKANNEWYFLSCAVRIHSSQPKPFILADIQGRDSMRNFDACFLCLQTAREPVSCTKGHLACKECFFENILAQKKEFSRMQTLYVAQQELIQKELDARIELLKQAEIERFEKTQTSLLGGKGAGLKQQFETREIDGKVYKGIKTSDGTVFVPEISAMTSAEKEKVYEEMKELDKAGAKKANMPSFWVPSLTPDAAPTLIEALPSKLELKCSACVPPHTIPSFKKLVKINFTYPKNEKSSGNLDERGASSAQKPICPSCMKGFTNGSKITVVKLCGHAVCKDCFARFIKGAGKCHVCDGPCKAGDAFDLFVEGRPAVLIPSITSVNCVILGTGFASSGGLEKVATKVDVAFQ
ncbi:hypothetical protein HDU84_006704 [Entophlyctis sp. JEL0112]|nr:hypothetical protein HDU84_006704 [Entophlyctis sp. JEL0112]